MENSYQDDRALAEIGLQAGELVLDRYQVDRCLGQGGLGLVVLAFDRKFNNSIVALKFLFPAYANDPQMFTRFRNEVLLAKNLRHENIVSVYTLSDARSDLYFISMEYVNGTTLYHEIYRKKRRFELLDILLLLDQIARGLTCAHNHAVIHRDLKPENILIDRNGTAKIADFGFATALDMTQRLTQAGTRVGTPLYMAPEQFTNAPLDERVDIYALGILGYELALGRHPYDINGMAGIEAIKKIFDKPLPKLASEESGIPLWFEKILRKCASKDREDRFSSVPEFLVEFRDYISRIQRVTLPPVSQTFPRVTKSAEIPEDSPKLVDRILGLFRKKRK